MTMLHFIESVIVPYVQSTKERLGLEKDNFALVHFDIFAAHRCDSILQSLERNHIKCIFIPANCTGELQLLDLTVNQVFKQELKACFIRWLAELV